MVGKVGATGTDLGYDQAGRLPSIPGILSSVTYNALGAPLVQTNANGTTTTKTYDAERFWLTDIDTSAPGGVALQQLSYTLNESGMAVAVDSNNVNEQWTYEYDADLNFLKSSVNGPAPGTANNQTWSYDSLGRFTGNSRVGTTFNYPSAGQARPHAPTSISGGPLGTLNFSYDPNGNLYSGNGRTMTWDAENRITQVVKGNSTTTFTYGPDGTRIKKVSGAATVRYPFGDDYEINGTTVTKYIAAGFGTIAKKVTKSGTMKTYWLHADRLGSVNAVTDNTGAQVLRQGFRTYGEIFGKTTVGGHTESLDYIGERTDSETGLTYLHARYYDPILGAFLSPDPAGADSNAYRYGINDPVNMTDRSGLFAAPYVDPCSIIACFDDSTNAVVKFNWESQGAVGSGYGIPGVGGGCEWCGDAVSGGGDGWVDPSTSSTNPIQPVDGTDPDGDSSATGTKGVATGAAQVLVHESRIRDAYNAAAKAWKAAGQVNRSELKADARELSTKFGKVAAAAFDSSRGPNTKTAAQLAESVARTNPAVNAAVSNAARIGNGVTAVSVLVSANNIVNAPDGQRIGVTAAEVGGIAGGWAGFIAGGELAAPLGPYAMVFGAVVGGYVGATQTSSALGSLFGGH